MNPITSSVWMGPGHSIADSRHHMTSYVMPGTSMVVGQKHDPNEERQDMMDRWAAIYRGVPLDIVATLFDGPKYVRGWVDPRSRWNDPNLEADWERTKRDIQNKAFEEHRDRMINQEATRVCGKERERTLVSYLDRRLTLLEWYLEFRGRLAAPVCVKTYNHGGAHEDKQGNEWPDRG